MESRYNHSFAVHNLRDPEIIVPYLITLFNPSSVVDVGCGLGNFLKVFLNYGVTDLLGLDGPWVNRSKLFIDTSYFIDINLEEYFNIGRKFDLVICLEVAEHLSENFSDSFVDNLTCLGDKIIFSAALPNQGGENHLNEQSIQYWVDKFEKRGYTFYDIFRNHFWNDNRISWWYKQNMFLVMNKKHTLSAINLGNALTGPVNDYIHPELFSIYRFRYHTLQKKMNNIMTGNYSSKFYFSVFKEVIKRKLFRKKMPARTNI